MFVREKRIGPYTYIYLVETVREGGHVKQRIIRNLGRKDEVERRGNLDRLVLSAARLAQRSMVLSLLDQGTLPDLACHRIGPPLIFERLWRDTQCGAVLTELLAERDFDVPLERAVFLTVLHRLMVAGSDRACEHWRIDYRIAGVEGLHLHHLYRAMAWLGEELPPAGQDGRTLTPRCMKLPRAGFAQGTARSAGCRAPAAGMAHVAGRSGSAAGDPDRAGRQVLHPAHAGDRGGRQGVPGGRRGAAAADPRRQVRGLSPARRQRACSANKMTHAYKPLI